MPKYFHFRAEKNGPQWDGTLATKQCQFIKPNGQQCKRNVIIGLPYCFQHRVKAFKVQIKPSTLPNAGQGLFAFNGKPNDHSIVFHNHDKIAPYNGELITPETLQERYGNNTAPYGLQISKNRISDGALHRGIGTLANHQPQAKSNVRFSVQRDPSKDAVLVAIKNIANNKELFVNYSRSYKMTERGVHSSTNSSKNKLTPRHRTTQRRRRHSTGGGTQKQSKKNSHKKRNNSLSHHSSRSSKSKTPPLLAYMGNL